MDELLTTWTFRTTPMVLFGRGSLDELPEQLRRTGAGRTFVVTDPGIAAAGILADVESRLDDADLPYESWPHVQPEPPSPSVDACANAIKAYGYAVPPDPAVDSQRILRLLGTRACRI